jgi:uncharacterized membrane protein YphA (DoxX/SURF4 family)
MKTLRIASRIIIGLIFIFSGAVKAIDPMGSAYKFHDYFQAFNIGFPDGLNLFLAISLCTIEFIAGFLVLTGFRQKSGLWLVIIMLTIFTPVTFILALTNPVSDCGCFGDAVHLTNWQTFAKNIVLASLAVVLYHGRNQSKQRFRTGSELIVISCSCFLFVLFALFNLRYLPVVDLLPYKPGVKIADKMSIPDGVPADEYQTTFIYEKDGRKKEFYLDNYPANDSTWKFVDQKSVLIKKGYQPPIHDFSITSMKGEDLTRKVLSHQGYTILMISRKLEETDNKLLEKGFDLGYNCTEKGIDFYILTASGTDKSKSFNNGLEFCSTDETTLKTIVRANPGYLFLKNGTIIGKWSWANVPDKKWFISQINGNFAHQ